MYVYLYRDVFFSMKTNHTLPSVSQKQFLLGNSGLKDQIQNGLSLKVRKNGQEQKLGLCSSDFVTGIFCFCIGHLTETENIQP